MPKVKHEFLHQLFRKQPAVLREILPDAERQSWGKNDEVTQIPGEFSDLMPVEYRADTCLLITGPGRKLAIVVEAQLRRDPQKPRRWLSYAAAVGDKHNCPVLVVVVTLDPRVERWAKKPVQFTLNTFVQPLVLGPTILAQPLTDEQLRRAPELGILATLAVAHKTEAIDLAERTIAAIEVCATQKTPENARLADEDVRLYIDFLLASLRPEFRKILEDRMRAEPKKFMSSFLQELHDKGVSAGEERGKRAGMLEGLAQGELKGRLEGERKGRVEGERESLAKLKAVLREALESRGLQLSKTHLASIDKATDPETIANWLVRVSTASSANEVFSGKSN